MSGRAVFAAALALAVALELRVRTRSRWARRCGGRMATTRGRLAASAEAWSSAIRWAGRARLAGTPRPATPPKCRSRGHGPIPASAGSTWRLRSRTVRELVRAGHIAVAAGESTPRLLALGLPPSLGVSTCVTSTSEMRRARSWIAAPRCPPPSLTSPSAADALSSARPSRARREALVDVADQAFITIRQAFGDVGPADSVEDLRRQYARRDHASVSPSNSRRPVSASHRTADAA